MAHKESADLYHTVVENDSAKLQELIEQGHDVDFYYEDSDCVSSKSLLHVCCGKGSIDCLKVLINNGVQLDVRDSWGQTPLMLSVSIQLDEVAQILLEADSELVDCQDKFGKSPLHLAVEVGNVELAQLLIQYGANINARTQEGHSPIMHCCLKNSDGDQLKVMKHLLKSGALIDLTDYKGKRSALHMAIVYGNVDAVGVLISAGANLNEVDKTLRTPLTHALYCGVRGSEIKETYSTIISLLVSGGADVNNYMTESCNPLMSSTLLRCEVLVRYFLSLGANSNHKFPSGITPALIAASTGDLDTLKTLIYYNCDLTSKGTVYKKRMKTEFVVDSFELAYLEGYLHLCVVMVKAGYPVYDKTKAFENDLMKTANAEWTPEAVPSRHYAPQETEFTLTLTKAQHLPDDFRVCLQWLVEMSRSPLRLRDAAILGVRSSLFGRLVTCVDELPLPGVVKRALLFTRLLTCRRAGGFRSSASYCSSKLE